MNRNMGFRFVVYFFLIMLAATAITSGASVMFLNHTLKDDVRKAQEVTAEALLTLDTDEFGNIVETEGIGVFDSYNVRRVDDTNAYVAKNKPRLDAGEILCEETWGFPSVKATYVMLNGNYYRISNTPDTSVVWQTVISLVLSAVSALLLGTFMAALAGKRFLRPIRELNKAIKIISRGNFNVRVSVPKNAEMRELVDNFNRMTRDLGSTETLQKDFVNNVSHEFKTPLASINGFAKLMQNEDLGDEQRREYAAIIAEESERLARLSASILQLTRLDNASAMTNVAEYSLDEQLRRTIVLLASQWEAKSIEMEVEVDSITVSGNKELLGEVWMNLLTNAIRYTPEHGHITVRATELLDDIQVEVEDDGCGMTPEVASRVFERFYQGDSSRSGEGNGLGLALVKRVVELSGGSVAVESTPGSGSIFRVRLPRD
ncbi:MAG: HAMP domain-containing histidine kinase [Ruminococcaceae bacterium]|nr:HAMP domain-containing histidine kinase [Oscillospiraceae bacterium]